MKPRRRKRVQRSRALGAGVERAGRRSTRRPLSLVRVAAAILALAVAAVQAAAPPLPVPLVVPALGGTSAEVREHIARARGSLDALLAQSSPSDALVAAAAGELGRVYAAYHLREAALAAFANARALAPEEGRWWYYSAVVMEQLGTFDEARTALAVAHRLEPADVPTAIRLGRLLLSAYTLEEAEHLFEQVLASHDDEAAAWHGLGEVARARGDCARALPRLARALELQPAAASIHYGLALCHRATGNRTAAEQHLRQHRDVAVRFDDPRIDELTAEVAGAHPLLQAANGAAAAGDFARAIELYRRAAVRDPNSAAARRGLATSHLQLGELGPAAEALERLLELEPDNAVALYDLAMLARGRGAIDQAAALLRRAATLAPDHTRAHLDLGYALLELGRPADAAGPLQHAYELTAGSASERELRGEAATGLARLELLREPTPAGLEQAAALLVEASELRPADFEPVLLHAQLLGRSGRYREAAAQFALAAERQPDHAGARLGGALALLLAGDHATARGWLERAQRDLPENADLEGLLARVLCCSPNDSDRDAARALDLARRLFAAAPSVERGATLAMALAATGDYRRAAELQAEVLRRARSQAPAADLVTLERCASEYAVGRPCLEPWRRP